MTLLVKYLLRNVFFTGGARINPSIIIIALMSRFGEDQFMELPKP